MIVEAVLCMCFFQINKIENPVLMQSIENQQESFTPCRFQTFSSGPCRDTKVTVTVPHGFKILNGGVSVYGETLVLSSYPSSANEWTCVHKPLARGAVNVTVVAVKDEDNILDSLIISSTAGSSQSNTGSIATPTEKKVDVTLPIEYKLVGGGADGGAFPLAASFTSGKGTWCVIAQHYPREVQQAYGLSEAAKEPRAFAIGIRRPGSDTAVKAAVRSATPWYVDLGEPFGEYYHCFNAVAAQSPMALERYLAPAALLADATRVVTDPDQLFRMKKQVLSTSLRK